MAQRFLHGMDIATLEQVDFIALMPQLVMQCKTA